MMIAAIFVISAICLMAGLVILQKKTHFICRRDRWSIGIYTGDSPYNFKPPKNVRNPVLTAKDVTDRRAKFVGDPFMVKDKDLWYMFFEVLDEATQRGEIGLAVSYDGFHWNYRQIVLSELFHLSYPYIFKAENKYYMIPESRKANYVRLYKAVDFPVKWSYAADLLTGSFSDSSIFYYANRWWMFTSITEGEVLTNDTLLLYFADSLFGPWTEHPQSPIIKGDSHIARPAGRVLVVNGKIVRYAQDDAPAYGAQVFAFEIVELTASTYREGIVRERPILKPNWKGWNKDGMHTIDPHFICDGQWIACVDGNARHLW